jgi:ectoine hydroxylase-related dioxygenase (phytanoyl-CoA dioxygenase family)
LNDATLENGCISVLPGWHKKGFLAHENTPIGLECHPSDHPEQGIPVPVKQGSLVAFLSLLPHKSGVNRSKGPRNAYIMQYARAGVVGLPENEPLPNLIPVAREGRPLSLEATAA